MFRQIPPGDRQHEEDESEGTHPKPGQQPPRELFSPKNTYIVDAQKLREARAAKGWTQQKLAGAARCDAKTIGRLEKGRPVYLNTLFNVANALLVDVKDLLADEVRDDARVDLANIASHPAAKTIRLSASQAAAAVKTCVVVQKDINAFTPDDKEELFQSIKRLVKAGEHTLELRYVEPGSVRLFFRMQASLVEPLLDTIDAGELDKFDVIAAFVVDDDDGRPPPIPPFGKGPRPPKIRKPDVPEDPPIAPADKSTPAKEKPLGKPLTGDVEHHSELDELERWLLTRNLAMRDLLREVRARRLEVEKASPPLEAKGLTSILCEICGEQLLEDEVRAVMMFQMKGHGYKQDRSCMHCAREVLARIGPEGHFIYGIMSLKEDEPTK